MELVTFRVLHIVRNGYYGTLENFRLYEGSKIKGTVDT
jgi:hypothetical protein